MRTILFLSISLGAFLYGSRASADVLYSTTDLGASYTLNSAPDNSANGVTAANGTTYAFDKSPISHIQEFYGNSDWPNSPPVPGLLVGTYTTLGAHSEDYMAYTLTDGTYRVGYIYDWVNGIPVMGASFQGGVTSDWVMHNGDSPVSDFNIHGQVVGMSDALSPISRTPKTFATFSALNFTLHHTTAGDNLNNYIAPIPGVSLTSAFKIDDDGRILATGSNGDTYLLDPVAPGLPSPVPEPASVAIFGLAILALGIRSARHRSR